MEPLPPAVMAPRRWEWFIPGEGSVDLRCAVEVKDGKLCWHIEPDHDAHRGGHQSEQAVADFLVYGPEHVTPPEPIARELAAHLGLADPPWLRPLEPRSAELLRRAQRRRGRPPANAE